jgi:uncharacterized membrane protein
MSSLPVLLFFMSGFMLEIGILLDQIGNKRYLSTNYAAYSKFFYYFFWILFAPALYGYIYHPMPYILPFEGYSIKFMYHTVIVGAYIYGGMTISYYLFKNIFRK